MHQVYAPFAHLKLLQWNWSAGMWENKSFSIVGYVLRLCAVKRWHKKQNQKGDSEPLFCLGYLFFCPRATLQWKW